MTTNVVKLDGTKILNNVKKYDMPIEEFLNLPEIFCQRDTKGRLKKALGHIRTLRTEHLDVAVITLTKDDEYHGQFFPAGTKMIGDGNTRRLAWAEYRTDVIPDHVRVTEYEFETLEECRKCYNTFDSQNATEKTAEKLYGCLVGGHQYYPKSQKIKNGQIVTALHHAACELYPSEFQFNMNRVSAMPGEVARFIEEIKILDDVMKDSTAWGAFMVGAALISLKINGCKNERLIEGLKLIDQRASDNRGVNGAFDGVTYIIEEHKLDKVLNKADNRWTNFPQGMSYNLYFLDAWINEKMLKKPGHTWKEFLSESVKGYRAYQKQNTLLFEDLMDKVS